MHTSVNVRISRHLLTYEYRFLWQFGRNIPLLGEKYIPNMYEVDVPLCCVLANDIIPVLDPNKSFCGTDRVCVVKKSALNFSTK